MGLKEGIAGLLILIAIQIMIGLWLHHVHGIDPYLSVSLVVPLLFPFAGTIADMVVERQ